MEFQRTAIPDLMILQPKVWGDSRGFFMETFRAQEMACNGIPGPFVQDNQSGSQRGTLRGLHYQIHQPQGKLIRFVVGEVFDVAVDLRRNSPTFGKWVGLILSAENKKQFWIPAGFAHGFYVLSDWAEIVYKSTDYYAPEWERTVLWNDPALSINWPVAAGAVPILSTKDQQGKPFSEAEVFE